MSTWKGYLLVHLLSLPIWMSCLNTGSFTHPGVTCLSTSISRSFTPWIWFCYPPLLPQHHNACQIPIPVSLRLLKYLLMLTLAASYPPFNATKSHSASHLPPIPSHQQKHQVSASTPTTKSLSPIAYQYTYPVSDYCMLIIIFGLPSTGNILVRWSSTSRMKEVIKTKKWLKENMIP